MDNIVCKTVVLSSGSGSALQRLLDARFFDGVPGMEIVAVIVPSDDCFAARRAEMAGTPLCLVDRSLFPSGKSFQRALEEKLDDLDTDVVVAADWQEPLSEDICRRWDRHIVVLSPQTALAQVSLLDRNGEPGPVLLEKAAADGEDSLDLSRSMLPEAVAMVCSGRLCIHGRQTKMLPVMPE